jgi:hypothetical protein
VRNPSSRLTHTRGRGRRSARRCGGGDDHRRDLIAGAIGDALEAITTSAIRHGARLCTWRSRIAVARAITNCIAHRRRQASATTAITARRDRRRTQAPSLQQRASRRTACNDEEEGHGNRCSRWSR